MSVSHHQLILVMGLPGSGKTYFASRLAQKLKCSHYNSDRIRKTYDRDPSYKESDKSKVYDLMFQRVCSELQEGFTVIVDATFSKGEYRSPYLNYCKEQEIPVRIFLLKAKESVIEERVSNPRPDSDADYQVYKKIKAEFEPCKEPYLSLYTDRYEVDFLIQTAIDYLGQELEYDC